MGPDQFLTRRLSVFHWRDELRDPLLRESLEDELITILTPNVLGPLPPSMQVQDRGISHWIDDRSAESDVLVVRQRHDRHLIGLMILALVSAHKSVPTVHLGYLISETAWGKGYASELLDGFVAACTSGPAVRLVAGVGRDNPASARVLQKSGFTLSRDDSSVDTEIYVREIGAPMVP